MTPDDIWDMAGNVWEWVMDRGGNYTHHQATNPQGMDTGTGRVLRGGSWGVNAGLCRSVSRSLPPPTAGSTLSVFVPRGRYPLPFSSFTLCRLSDDKMDVPFHCFATAVWKRGWRRERKRSDQPTSKTSSRKIVSLPASSGHLSGPPKPKSRESANNQSPITNAYR
jgi:hypothetical protein